MIKRTCLSLLTTVFISGTAEIPGPPVVGLDPARWAREHLAPAGHVLKPIAAEEFDRTVAGLDYGLTGCRLSGRLDAGTDGLLLEAHQKSIVYAPDARARGAGLYHGRHHSAQTNRDEDYLLLVFATTAGNPNGDADLRQLYVYYEDDRATRIKATAYRPRAWATAYLGRYLAPRYGLESVPEFTLSCDE